MVTRTLNKQLAAISNDPFAKALDQMANSPMTRALDQMANSPMTRALDQIANSPMARALDQMANSPMTRALDQIANSPMTRALDQIANSPMTRALDQMAKGPMARALDQIANSPMTRALTYQKNDPFTKIARQFSQDPVARMAKQLAGGPAFKMLNASRLDQTLSNRISSTFAQLEEVDEEDTEHTFELLQSLVAMVIDALRNAKYPLSRRAVLNFTIWLLPFLFAYVSSVQVEEQHSEILQQIEQLVDLHEKQVEQEQQITIYVVRRVVPLNIERKFRGGIEKILIPGEELELVGRAGKWIKVRVYDHFSDDVVEGWVLKKYVRRVQ